MAKVGIVDCESKKTSAIIDCVSFAGLESETINWNKANTYNFKNMCSLIISGGPHLFTESQKIKKQLMEKVRFIKTLSIPTLGICLGHQAIAITLGGSVYKGSERRHKDPVNILKQHPLFEGLPEVPVFAEDHCEGVKLSNQMIALASSEHYPIEAFAAINKPFFGVQFHPETSGCHGKKVISNFLQWQTAKTLGKQDS